MLLLAPKEEGVQVDPREHKQRKNKMKKGEQDQVRCNEVGPPTYNEEGK